MRKFRHDAPLDFADLFCGAGGASTGLVAAGWELKLAANHWDKAIETHAANHPAADHLQCDINNLDMRRLPRTRILWASVICTEVSPAGGRQRKASAGPGQLPLEAFGAIRREGYERTRATALDVIRATEVHRYEVVVVENVVNFALEWELFDWWRKGMELLGYTSQVVSVSSAHVGGEGNDPAAQWRDRIYILFARKDVPLPAIAPRPLACCEHCSTDVQAVQSWRRGATIGKYRDRFGPAYDYRCPDCQHYVEPYVRPAGTIVNWADLGIRIGDRHLHGLPDLAAKTRARIDAGLLEHGPAITLAAAGNTYERRPGVRTWPMSHPLGTQSTTATHGIAVDPFIFSVNHAGDGARAVPAHGAPLTARSTKIGDGLVVPIRTNATATRAAAEPWKAMTAGTAGQAIVTPEVVAASFIAELRGGGSSWRSIGEPFATFAAGGKHHGLVIPYRKGRATTTATPMHTLGTRDSAALVTAAELPRIEVDDCYFRMITPEEGMLAQRFPDDYIVIGNKGERTMLAGNAVSCNVAQWLGDEIRAALDAA